MSAQLKSGYKQTEMGVIPSAWEVKLLGTVIRLQRGFDLPHYKRRMGSIPIISSSGLCAYHDKPQATGPGVVTGRYGTIGEVFFVEEDYWPLNTTLFVKDFKGNDPLYTSFLLRTVDFHLHSGKSGVPGVNRNDLHEIPVACPPVSEQRAIAAALSDVDALISGLDNLIAKKHDIKQAALQQLLTGQTRLPGFSGEWETKRLGNLGHFLKGSGVRKNEALSGDLPCIRYGEIYTRHSNYIKAFQSWISRDIAGAAILLKQGDLLFAGSGETKTEIGKCVAFVDDIEAYAGGDIVILRPDNTNAMFMGYLMNTAPINAQKSSRGQGDAVVHISASALSSIDVKMPKVEEQTAIFSDMDVDITTLETRRDKTCDLKQGMMQELLTGRIRLV